MLSRAPSINGVSITDRPRLPPVRKEQLIHVADPLLQQGVSPA